MPALQSQVRATEPVRTGIDRTFAEEAMRSQRGQTRRQSDSGSHRSGRDSGQKPKTTLPHIAGGFKLPPSSLLHRPDEQQAVDADELKLLAQVLTGKYAEFDVHGQITQINPGRWSQLSNSSLRLASSTAASPISRTIFAWR